MGYITRINSNGNAEGNYTLLARKKGKDGWGIMPVGTFFLNENNITGLPVSKGSDNNFTMFFKFKLSEIAL